MTAEEALARTRLGGERRGAELALQEAEHRSRLMLESVEDYAILMLDPGGRVVSWNAGAQRIKGYKPEEIIGRHFAAFYAPEDLAAGKPAKELAIAAAEGRLEDEGWRVRKDGTRFWAGVVITALHDPDGALCGYCKVTRDLSERRAYEQRLAEMSHRRLRAVTDSMGEALCTLDHAGHVSYINPAAERLLGWGTAELQEQTLHEVVHFRRRLNRSVHTIDDCPMHTGHKARVAVRVADDTFVRRDGTALPVSWVLTPVQTPEGDSSVIVITDNTRVKLAQRQLRRDIEQLEQVRAVHEALNEQRFELFAQPIIDLRSGATVSHELLLRMRERDGTIRAPCSFLPAAERSGVIHELDRWVIGQAARLAGAGHDVELNLSADSLGDPSLADDFIAAVTEHGADPARIVVELTETALLPDDTVAWTFIERIRALGCEFALDDFGTGFGTFSYLKRLPIDYLKIDIDFVRDLRSNPASRNVVEAVVALARSFGHRTIAEGVEDDETLQTLRRMGVDYAQGYLIGHPSPIATTLEQWAVGRQDGSRGDRPAEDPESAIDRTIAVIDAPIGARACRHGDAVTDRAARAFVAALRYGDPYAAAAVIDGVAAQDGLSPVQIQARVIAPAMRRIGELWELDALTVAHEHLATAVSNHILMRLYPGLLGQAPCRSGSMVVVSAVQGEHHVLGLRMAADVFEGAGFDVRFLGADVPQASLLAWVAERRPTIVALGVTMPLNGATLIRSLQALRDRDPALQLVVGGPGVPAVLRRSAGVFYAASTEQLADYAYASNALNAPAQSELPSGLARGGAGFGPPVDRPPALSGGLELRLAETAAAAADVARRHARRAVVLEQIAFRDPLTELWNRRAFDDRHQTVTDEPVHHPATILMIDIDRFKSVNDRFGHDAGDRALVGVTRCITESLRPTDFAARYGGDEFALLLPDTPLELAAEIAERIRSQVENELTDPQLTVSIGISVPDHADRRLAILDADRALYKAKERRNQVALA